METHPVDPRTGRFPWQAAVLFVAIAAITRAPALIVLAFGSGITWLVVEITGRLALAAVDARVTLTPDRIVAGELPVATVEIVNRKPIPLPWLDARLFLGEGVDPPNPLPGAPHGWIDCGFPMRGRERVLVRLPVRVPARGAYAIGPLRLRAGDWLGFTQSERTVALAPEVTAYPAPLAVRDRALASLRPLAETATRRGLVPDPLRFRGVRPHRRGDARKEIHWKASARLRELQTKLYEPPPSLASIFPVIVTPRLGSGLANAAVALRRAHHRVLIVSVDEIPAALAAHLVVQGVSHDLLTPRERSAAV